MAGTSPIRSDAPASIRYRLLVMYCAYLGEGWCAKTTRQKRCSAPRRRDVAALFVVLATRTTTLSGKTDRYTSAGAGLQSPVSTRDVRDDLRSKRGTEHRCRRGDLPRRAPRRCIPINWNLDRSVLGFYGIGSDRSPPATRQATTRSASRALMIRTLTPGWRNASHGIA